MKHIAEGTSRDKQPLWQNRSWYGRALTLSERIALSGQEEVAEGQIESNDARATQRLRRWKEQPPFDRGTYFAQRLEMDHLSEEQLLALLEESSTEKITPATPPEWLTLFAQAFETQLSHITIDFGLPETEHGTRTAAFLNVLAPFLQQGMVHVQQGIERLCQEYQLLPFDTNTITTLLAKQFPEYMLPRFMKTVVLELNVARVQGKLQGETPEERFHYFLHMLGEPEALQEFFKEYAVLARIVVEAVKQWVTVSLEWLERLYADWKEICSSFTPESDPGVLVDVQIGLGDPHRDGRSVIVLVWSSGFRLVYKPHSVDIDVHFQEVLAWFNHAGYQPTFRILQIINKGTYGWIEFVQAGSCSTKEEIERFYQRQGGYLALLYVLEARDFHFENLIAAGEHPILIDLETLLQPPFPMQEHIERDHPGIEIINHSVLRVGFLPQRIWASGQAEGVDVSSLGGQAGQLTPMPVAKWAGSGTDQMHIKRERVEIAAKQHLPKLLDQTVNAFEYCECIVAGFTAAYRLLLQRREEFIANVLPRFVHDEIRYLLRGTQTYNVIRMDSYHPDVLRDALDRDRLFDRLWIGVEQQPFLARLIPFERADLQIGDIPKFVTYPDSRNLYSSQGDVIPDMFEISGLETVCKLIAQFDEQDLERQIWIIRASFTSLALVTDRTTRNGLNLRPTQAQASSEDLMRAACAVGDRLDRLVIRGEENIGWLSITPVGEREWHLLPTMADLYSGTAGIALFLGYLGALTGESRYTTLAKVSLDTVRKYIARQTEEVGVGSLGAFDGIGAYIYLLSHLGTLWNEPALYQEAEEAVKLLTGAISQDGLFDIIGGSAGCIAALLSLHAVTQSEAALATAIECGNHLLASAKQMSQGIGWIAKHEQYPLAGLAHGNAGIALSLSRLFKACGDERFLKAALAAVAYEQSLFSPEKKNWPDLRVSVNTLVQGEQQLQEQRSYMVAWCHGAPGVGLARLEMLKCIDTPAIRADIDAALQTVLAEGFGWNHSLCHGDMGNVDALLLAAKLLPDTSYAERVQFITPILLESINTQGWVTGVPHGVETPGLMTGIAGIGYELLRLAAPERIPSVLVVAPPV